jgi:quercetin dioxygenase-like cupin family protein
VRTEEKPHYHRFHDLTVTVIRGEGVLNVGTRAIRMKEGDVAHVHRGTAHFFRNTGKEPAAAFVVFSPPFDGRDTVSAKDAGEAAVEEAAAKPKKSGWFW